jgi:hypothetical protein
MDLRLGILPDFVLLEFVALLIMGVLKYAKFIRKKSPMDGIFFNPRKKVAQIESVFMFFMKNTPANLLSELLQ